MDSNSLPYILLALALLGVAVLAVCSITVWPAWRSHQQTLTSIDELETRVAELEREASASPALAVRVDQPLGRLAFTLLEPRSDDGFANWALLDEQIETGSYPVVRVR